MSWTAKPSSATTVFHHRFYRYARMMLRRYPKMRQELYAWSCNNSGVTSILGGLEQRRRVGEAVLKAHQEKHGTTNHIQRG